MKSSPSSSIIAAHPPASQLAAHPPASYHCAGPYARGHGSSGAWSGTAPFHFSLLLPSCAATELLARNPASALPLCSRVPTVGAALAHGKLRTSAVDNEPATALHVAWPAARTLPPLVAELISVEPISCIRAPLGRRGRGAPFEFARQ